MAGIYHPSRGGTRGGKDQFNWDDVKTDKERENYLGHSLMVPVGKWQEGKDLMWYTRDKKTNLSEKELKKKQELKAVKDLEARAMAAALGHKSFTTGTTSLTAKELQDVLSRGQTEHTEGERIQGVGHKKKLSSSKTEKSGITFDGFDASGRNDNETYEEKDQSLKKKKNKKEKKKKKKKKIQASDDEESDVEISTNRRRRYSSSENTGKNRHNERKIDPTDKRGRENTRHRHYEDKNKRRDDDRRVSPHRRRRSISPRDSYRRQRSRSHSVERHKNVNRKHSNDYRQSSRRQSRSPIRKLTPPHRHDKKRRYRHSNNSSDEDRRR